MTHVAAKSTIGILRMQAQYRMEVGRKTNKIGQFLKGFFILELKSVESKKHMLHSYIVCTSVQKPPL